MIKFTWQNKKFMLYTTMDNSSKALAERTDCECDVMWIWNQILYRFELVPSSRSNKSGKESGRQTCFCCLEWPILKVSTPCSVNISHSSGFPTGIYHMMHKIWHYILLCLCPVNAAPVRLPLLSLCVLAKSPNIQHIVQ